MSARPADVRSILLTHWHNDHAAGARAVQERSGASVYYHEGDARELTGVSARRGARGWFARQVPELGPLVLLKGLLGEATPRPVEATRFVEDGEAVADEFEVVETPGHTPGHVSFYHRPTRILFAGDAPAVIDERIRYMARPVTPDLVRSRLSMIRCLDRPIAHLCPGHRRPLSLEVDDRRREMLERLRSGEAWPLFG